MRILHILLAVIPCVLSTDPEFISKLLRNSLSDCAVCESLTVALSNEIILDQIDTAISERCEKLPDQFTQICEKAAKRTFQMIKEYLAEKVEKEDCAALCALPKLVTAEQVCPLLQAAHGGLDSLISGISSEVLPSFCNTHKNPIQCADKIGKIIQTSKKPIALVIAKFGNGLDPEGNCGIEDVDVGEKMKLAEMVCSACDALIAIVRSSLVDERTYEVAHPLFQKIFTQTCEKTLEENECDQKIEEFLKEIMEEFQPQLRMCTAAFNCEEKKPEKTEL